MCPQLPFTLHASRTGECQSRSNTRYCATIGGTPPSLPPPDVLTDPDTSGRTTQEQDGKREEGEEWDMSGQVSQVRRDGTRPGKRH